MGDFGDSFWGPLRHKQRNDWANQPTNNPTKSPANQPAKEPTKQASKHQPANPPARQPTNQASSHPTASQPVNHQNKLTLVPFWYPQPGDQPNPGDFGDFFGGPARHPRVNDPGPYIIVIINLFFSRGPCPRPGGPNGPTPDYAQDS